MCLQIPVLRTVQVSDLLVGHCLHIQLEDITCYSENCHFALLLIFAYVNCQLTQHYSLACHLVTMHVTHVNKQPSVSSVLTEKLCQ